jgi:hypothetical protein
MSNTQPLWRDIRFVRGAAGGAVLAGIAVGAATVGFFPRAHAAETAVTAPGSAFAEQILGKAGPAESLSPDTIPADFRLLRLVDASSRVGFYVTHGDTLSAGGQTFLLAYQVALYTDADGVQKIARGQDMSLALVNMSSVEIIDQMGPVPEVGTPPPPHSQQ